MLKKYGETKHSKDSSEKSFCFCLFEVIKRPKDLTGGSPLIK